MKRAGMVLCGDWNADARTDRAGTHTPFWLARKAGLQLWTTGPGRHGLIDYALSAGDVELVQRKRVGNGQLGATGARGSDHDAIVCVVRRTDTGAQLRLLFWNVERDRPTQLVLAQLGRLVRDHEPDVIVLNEAAQYLDQLRHRFAAWRFVAGRLQVNSQTVLMIGPGHRVTGDRVVQLTPGGWITESNAVHGPLYAPTAVVDGWCRFVGVHLPPSVNWAGPIIHGPIRRVACYVAAIRKLRAWVKHWRKAAAR